MSNDELFGNTKTFLEDVAEMNEDKVDGIGFGNEFVDVPIETIEFRSENSYAKENIEGLAHSIYEIGLREPIQIRSNTSSNKSKKLYVLVDGERRLRASLRALEIAKEQGDKKKIKKLSTIKSRVLTEDDEKNEERIHKESNDLSRTQTPFQKILRMNPSRASEYFGSDNTNQNRHDYVKRKYGFGDNVWEKYKNQIKWNEGTVVEDIKLRFYGAEKTNSTKESTIQRYITIINKLIPDIKEAVAKGTADIELNEAKIIAELNPSSQETVAKKLLAGKSFDEAIVGFVSKKEGVVEVINTPAPRKKKPKTPEASSSRKLVHKAGNVLIKFKRDYKSVLDKLDTKNLNGNQKEYLKKINKIIKEIEELEEIDR